MSYSDEIDDLCEDSSSRERSTFGSKFLEGAGEGFGEILMSMIGCDLFWFKLGGDSCYDLGC